VDLPAWTTNTVASHAAARMLASATRPIGGESTKIR